MLLLLIFFSIVESFSECYCLIIFEWCVWFQRCVGLVDISSGVCGKVVGSVCMGECAGAHGTQSIFVVGCNFDY